MAAQRTVLPGAVASPGLAAGAVRAEAGFAFDGAELPAAEREAEAARAAAALESAAERLDALAADAGKRGRADEAGILEAGAMMARDPALGADVAVQIGERGRTAPAALVAATESFAATLAEIDDPLLAARAEDVRSVGRRAARIAAGGEPDAERPAHGPVVVLAPDLGPADVAELGDDVCAVALAGGAVTAHAAIVARARGLPMLVGLGQAALDVGSGSVVVVDADAGALVFEPAAELLERARATMSDRAAARARAVHDRDLPAVTRDGQSVRVLCNAASAAEVAAGLESGADGAGLVRTELAFLEASAWPTEDEHRAVLDPVLAALAGRTATVRVLDFGGDKTPPFLAGTSARGLALLLESPGPFADQVRAILDSAARTGCDLRLLLPMVQSTGELAAARELTERVASGLAGVSVPSLGAMIETPEAALAASDLARNADFLSIGTNDLTHATLRTDRWSAVEAPAQDPAVLRMIELSVSAAHAAGRPIEVCGEAASDAAVLPLLVGLGVDELSVGAARVGPVRRWVRELDSGECRERVAAALGAGATR